MDRRYRGVLLDVDGTLVDSNDAHAHAWEDAFAAHDLAMPYTRIRSLIGMGGDHLIEALTGISPSSRAHRKIAAHARDRFQTHWLHQVRPILGARSLVLRLRHEGYQYAIASSASTEQLAPLLAIAEVADLCEIRASASDAARSKPDPDILDASLARLDVERSRTVLIGDTPYDVAAARSARIDAIGVASGGFPAEQLSGAVAVFDGAFDLLARWDRSPLA
jgi:HAD superfamily hydrolase (TIGR01509 family)